MKNNKKEHTPQENSQDRQEPREETSPETQDQSAGRQKTIVRRGRKQLVKKTIQG